MKIKTEFLKMTCFLMSSENYDDLGKTSILIDDVGELYLNSFVRVLELSDPGVYPTFLNYQLMGSLHKAMISVEAMDLLN